MKKPATSCRTQRIKFLTITIHNYHAFDAKQNPKNITNIVIFPIFGEEHIFILNIKHCIPSWGPIDVSWTHYIMRFLQKVRIYFFIIPLTYTICLINVSC